MIVLLIIAVAALVVWVVRDGRANEQRKRAPLSACDVCGYNLTGSQGACPECGRLQPFFVCVRCHRKIFRRPPGHCPFCDA